MSEENGVQEVKELTPEEIEFKEKQQVFDRKTKGFRDDLDEIASKYNVGFVVASYFIEEDTMGVEKFGKISEVEALGLGKRLEQRIK